MASDTDEPEVEKLTEPVCGDCFFFKNHQIGGRDTRPCSEVGEVETGEVCVSFRSRYLQRNPLLMILRDEQMKTKIKPQDPTRYFDVFDDIGQEAYNIEGQIKKWVTEEEHRLRHNGKPGNIKGGKAMIRTVGDLSEVRILDELVQVFGLDRYRDQIVSYAIHRLFARKGTPPTSVGVGADSPGRPEPSSEENQEPPDDQS